MSEPLSLPRRDQSELSAAQKMFVLLAEIRQCINDDNLMAAQRKVRAIEEHVSALSARIAAQQEALKQIAALDNVRNSEERPPIPVALERWNECIKIARKALGLGAEAKVSQHGVTCPKVLHVGGGYLHNRDDDEPYFVDGLTYCGRCHVWIPEDVARDVRQAILATQQALVPPPPSPGERER